MGDEDTVDSIAAQEMGGGEPAEPSAEPTAPESGHGGAAPPEGEPQPEPEPAAAGEDGQATEGEDDDDDDHADLDETLKAHPAVRRLLNRGRKYRRQLAKHRPLAEVVQAVGGVDKLPDILAKARNYDTLIESQRARLQRGGSEADREKTAEAPPDWDDPNFPFDKADPAGRYLFETIKGLHTKHSSEVQELKQAIAGLERKLSGLDSGLQRERVTAVQQQWIAETDRAAQQVPEAARAAFKDLVFGAYRQATERGIALTPQQAIEHYAKMFKALNGSSAALKAAATQQRAEHAQNQPGRTAFSGGSPASARDKATETLDDIFEREGIYVP